MSSTSTSPTVSETGNQTHAQTTQSLPAASHGLSSAPSFNPYSHQAYSYPSHPHHQPFYTAAAASVPTTGAHMMYPTAHPQHPHHHHYTAHPAYHHVQVHAPSPYHHQMHMHMSPYTSGVASGGRSPGSNPGMHHYHQPHQRPHQYGAEKPLAAMGPAPKTSGLFWVREDRAGAIIGKQGTVIKELQTKSKTDIQVHNDVVRNGHKLVTVLGNPKQINVAVRLIARTVR